MLSAFAVFPDFLAMQNVVYVLIELPHRVVGCSNCALETFCLLPPALDNFQQALSIIINGI